MEKKTFGETLDQLRKEKNMSVEELSQKTGINVVEIKANIGNVRKPWAQSVKKYADALGCDYNSLYNAL